MGAIDYICVICDERVELTSYLQHLNSHRKCARCTLRLCPDTDTCAVDEPASKKFRGNHEKVILCPIRECSARFALPNKFQRHHTSKHSDKGKETLSCKEGNCSFSTVYRESLTRHMREQHKPKRTPFFACDKCDYQTNRKSNMDRHKAAYHKAASEADFICDMCGEAFKSTATLSRHNLNSCKFRKQEERPEYKCDHKDTDGKICDKVVSCPQVSEKLTAWVKIFA